MSSDRSRTNGLKSGARFAAAAIAIGLYYDLVMLRPLPDWLGVNLGLAAVATGIVLIAGAFAFLTRAWRSVGVGSAVGLFAAAAHLEIRASDTRIGVLQAVTHALYQWRFLALLVALAVLATWTAYRLRVEIQLRARKV